MYVLTNSDTVYRIKNNKTGKFFAGYGWFSCIKVIRWATKKKSLLFVQKSKAQDNIRLMEKDMLQKNLTLVVYEIKEV